MAHINISKNRKLSLRLSLLTTGACWLKTARIQSVTNVISTVNTHTKFPQTGCVPQEHTIPTHASQLPFAFSVCLLIHFLHLISSISVHFQSIISFVFHARPSLIHNGNKVRWGSFFLTLSSPPPTRSVSLAFVLYRTLRRTTLFCTCCSLHPPSPWKQLLVLSLLF